MTSNTKYYCFKCNKIIMDREIYFKHLLSNEHYANLFDINRNNNLDKNKIEKIKKYVCICGKRYVNHSSLYRHKKKCS